MALTRPSREAWGHFACCACARCWQCMGAFRMCLVCCMCKVAGQCIGAFWMCLVCCMVIWLVVATSGSTVCSCKLKCTLCTCAPVAV